jgi:hypothetical protein
MIPIAQWIGDALAAYSILGVLFAAAFLSTGIGRVDSIARGSSLGFRLIILPGVIGFWPLLLTRWIAKGAAAK